jgi:hypothetical protein
VTVGEHVWGTAETADSPEMPTADGSIHGQRHARHVREDSTLTSDESGMSDCGSAEPTAEPTAVTHGDRIRRFAAWLVARIHAPDIWEDRPGLGKLVAYAHNGAGAPADGPLRTLEVWWFRLVCLPITAWAYGKAWALERPFRGWLVLLLQLGWWLLNIATLIRFL